MSDRRPMAMHLTTRRLVLRPWDLADVADYRSLVAERGEGTPAPEDVRARITNQLAATAETGIALLAVHRRAEEDFIGYAGIVVGRACVEEPEIAYELFRRVHGCGYATEAAEAVLRAAGETGRTKVWATTRPWNGASLRVPDKLGFQRDHVTADERGEVVWLVRSLT